MVTSTPRRWSRRAVASPTAPQPITAARAGGGASPISSSTASQALPQESVTPAPPWP